MIIGTLIIVIPIRAAELDSEIRCCFSIEGLRGEFPEDFVITLQGEKYPIGHLEVTTPTDAVLGFDAKSHKFFPPLKEGIYGNGGSWIDIGGPISTWLGNPQRTMVLFNVHEGLYQVRVIGLRNGKYKLEFMPRGMPKLGPQTRSVDKSFAWVPIKLGEAHTYVFQGKFDNPLDPNIPWNSPTRFEVKRVQ